MSRKPWQQITWSDEHQQTIYRDWGVDYSQKQQYEKATVYYNKSLELKKDDVKALYRRSLCQSDVAQTEGALEDALQALALNDMNHLVNLQVCDALYDSNMFEKCKVELADKSKKFTGRKLKPFQQRMEMVEQNFMDSVGDFTGPFLQKNSKNLDSIVERINQDKAEDNRPLWKILKEQDKCDVVSVREEEERKLHPREKSSLELNYKIFAQVYFQKGWKDLAFLKSLRNDKRLLLSQTTRTTPHLAKVVNEQYDIVYKFLKMLQARNPLYTQRYKMCPNQKLAAKIKEAHLYRVQYQTRRDMFNILETAHKFRNEGNIEKLAYFIEKWMGDYIETKTTRVMPRKFEFTNEIYNILALAYCDKLTVPDDIMDHSIEDRMFVLMRLPTEKEKDHPPGYKFGDKSTFQEPDAIDYNYIAYKKITTRLENRLQFAKHPIERCYMLHEIARNHLSQSKTDEGRLLGKKIVDEAALCHNYVWKFLGALIICKADTMQRKLEKIKASLAVAKEIADRLADPRINYFMETCERVNQIAIELKQNYSEEMLFKGRQRMKSSAPYSSRLSISISMKNNDSTNNLSEN